MQKKREEDCLHAEEDLDYLLLIHCCKQNKKQKNDCCWLLLLLPRKTSLSQPQLWAFLLWMSKNKTPKKNLLLQFRSATLLLLNTPNILSQDDWISSVNCTSEIASELCNFHSSKMMARLGYLYTFFTLFLRSRPVIEFFFIFPFFWIILWSQLVEGG